jgi:hypothetical protein
LPLPMGERTASMITASGTASPLTARFMRMIYMIETVQQGSLTSIHVNE